MAARRASHSASRSTPEGEAYDLRWASSMASRAERQVVRVVTTVVVAGVIRCSVNSVVLCDVIEGRVSLRAAHGDLWCRVSGRAITPESPSSTSGDERAPSRDGKARTAPLSMIDRGDGYEKMPRGEHRPRMR